jgi:DNA-binding transcriptional regulator LsrR (DeoR family)
VPNTLRIAHDVLVEGKTIEAAAEAHGITPKTVRNHVARARKEGLVNTFVAPRVDVEDLTSLELELKARFSLKEAIVVQGAEQVMDADGGLEKEAVLLSCCFRAANYLGISLRNGDTLAVPWGRVASYIGGYLVPKRRLPNLTVVPMIGVMSVDSNPFEANTIAAKVGTAFGAKHLMLAAPAILSSPHYQVFKEVPLVKSALHKLAQSNVALTTIAAPNPQTSTIVRKGLATRAEVEAMVKLGAVGEIASHWWFDKHGERIGRSNALPIGLGLKGLRRVIENEGRVIAVVAASRERIAPTRVALVKGLVNVLITDHVSARELLSGAPA